MIERLSDFPWMIAQRRSERPDQSQLMDRDIDRLGQWKSDWHTSCMAQGRSNQMAARPCCTLLLLAEGGLTCNTTSLYSKLPRRRCEGSCPLMICRVKSKPHSQLWPIWSVATR